MPSSKTDHIVFQGSEGERQAACLHRLLFSANERLLNAAKMLLIAWLLAAVTVFIPIAHFFLVPLFLIAGPVMAWKKYKAEMVADKVTGVCPECDKDIEIVLDSADTLPKHSYCPACNKPLQLVYDGDGL